MLSWLSYFKNINIHAKEKAQLQQRSHNVSVAPFTKLLLKHALFKIVF